MSLSGPQFPHLSAWRPCCPLPSELSRPWLWGWHSLPRCLFHQLRGQVGPRPGSLSHSRSLAPSHQSPSFPEATLFPMGPSDSSVPPANQLGRTSYLWVRVIRGPPQLLFWEDCWLRTFVGGGGGEKGGLPGSTNTLKAPRREIAGCGPCSPVPCHELKTG